MNETTEHLGELNFAFGIYDWGSSLLPLDVSDETFGEFYLEAWNWDAGSQTVRDKFPLRKCSRGNNTIVNSLEEFDE